MPRFVGGLAVSATAFVKVKSRAVLGRVHLAESAKAETRFADIAVPYRCARATVSTVVRTSSYG